MIMLPISIRDVEWAQIVGALKKYRPRTSYTPAIISRTTRKPTIVPTQSPKESMTFMVVASALGGRSSSGVLSMLNSYHDASLTSGPSFRGPTQRFL